MAAPFVFGTSSQGFTLTEPFKIATLQLGTSRGRIGVCRLPGAGHDLDEDLQTIAMWNPAVVVSLTEADEMESLGAGSLPARFNGAGTAWRHFPIRDFDVPSDGSGWDRLSVDLHSTLDAGGAVLVHCRGGLGRSGMIALRLLIERGEDPTAALQRIRAARPGAVETDEQLKWAEKR